MVEPIPGPPRHGRRTPGSGRKPGTPNKITQSIREAVREAFERRGGVEGLLAWADTNPDAFYALVAKLIPSEVVATHHHSALPPEDLSPEQLDERIAMLREQLKTSES